MRQRGLGVLLYALATGGIILGMMIGASVADIVALIDQLNVRRANFELAAN